MLAWAPAAFAADEPTGPLVDVVEIAGVIDRPIERYAIEEIDKAEGQGAALLVFQVDSLAGMKIAGGEAIPRLVAAIRDARVPIAVHIGPRGARARGAAAFMLQAAHIASMGPSARLGPMPPVDDAESYASHDGRAQQGALATLAAARGRTIRASVWKETGANAALEGGLVEYVVPSVAELLGRLNGKTVQTAAGAVTLSLPKTETIVRFSQPGPIRRLLHAFANPALVYLSLLVGAGLLVFELFQPGFGVAGVTAGLLLAGGGYGLTVLPARREMVAAFIVSIALLALDVWRDEILLPTVAGGVGLSVASVWLFPRASEATRLSPWLVGSSILAAIIFFIPGMTVVRRARKPIATEVKRQLIGEGGQVRSMLNPEGFILVGDEIWRARSEDGTRVRVGEDVVVSRIDGTVLVVRAPGTNGADPASLN